ncbi:MAG TPA: threonine synthase [Candidatus Limnocylindrales bacterium]|nr:threonine synthase [Candidatus Limnocylindrales bacterium]
MAPLFQLRCRECGRSLGNGPIVLCEECFSPVEVAYDLNAVRECLTREKIAARPANIWRYAELLPVAPENRSELPVGFTPLVPAPRLGPRIGSHRLYLKNDAACFPTLSFKDRVVAIALAQAKAFGFGVVGCSSTGNLANAVAAQAVRNGLDAWIFIPADLEPAKILGTEIFGARVIRIAGNYDQVNRLCAQIAERYQWGFVNVNLRPYYAEGSKTVGFEIAEQLGWHLPDNVVVPMAGGALITKISKAFQELSELGFVEAKPVKFFGAQATGCSPISTAIKNRAEEIDPQRPRTICRSLAIGNPADGYNALKTIRSSEGWAEDASDPEIVAGIRLLAETEGIFAETAGGVTVAAAKSLFAQGRLRADETTVLCITGNGLKTTDALAGKFTETPAIEPKLAAFEAYLAEVGAPVAGD